jgi:hypothetical protein
MLALALLVSVSQPAGAVPTTTAGAGDTVEITQSIVDAGAPTARFQFSVLDQLTTAVAKTIANIGGTVQPGGTTTATVQAGQLVTFQINLTGLQAAVGSTVQIADFFNSNLLFQSGDACTTTVPAGATVPAGQNGVGCAATVQTGGTAQLGITFLVSSTTPANTVLNNQACAQAAAGVGNFTACGNASVTTGNVTFNNQQAQTQAQGTPGFTQGQAGVPCATLIGQVCNNAGAVTGTCNVTGSMTCTKTTTVPAGVGAGATPIDVAVTTNGFEFIQCSPVLIGTTTVTCTGTLTGNLIQGSTNAICFPGVVACNIGTVTGPGGINNNIFPPIFPNLPLLPPPPLEFIPPPPPPLLPPPPPAPMGGMMQPRTAGFPEVPVIPEADSLFLLVGGLVALGGLVGYRKLRRNDDD